MLMSTGLAFKSLKTTTEAVRSRRGQRVAMVVQDKAGSEYAERIAEPNKLAVSGHILTASYRIRADL